MPTITETVGTDGVRVASIAWRQARAPYAGRVEAILDANPGLASQAIEIPAGTVLRLPVLPDATEVVVERVDLSVMIGPSYDVLIDGASVLGTVKPRLIALDAYDKAGTSSDTVTVQIDNSDGLVALPPPGRRMTVLIMGVQVFAGTVDSLRSSGSRAGRDVTIGAKGFDVTGKAKEPQNRTFESKTVRQMMDEAGAAGGVSRILIDDALAGVTLTSMVMDGESFAAFGQRLAGKIGGTFKLRPDAAVIAQRNAGRTPDGRAIPPLIAKVGKNLHSWEIEPFAGRERFAKVIVRYRDRAAGAWKEIVEETDVEGATAGSVGRYTANDKVEAEAKAKSLIEDTKRGGGSGSVTIEGTPYAVAEGTVTVAGTGIGVDGSYRIETVQHQLSRASGYTTTIGLAFPTP